MSSPKGNAERAPGGGRHFFAENLKNFRGCCTFSCNFSHLSAYHVGVLFFAKEGWIWNRKSRWAMWMISSFRSRGRSASDKTG